MDLFSLVVGPIPIRFYGLVVGRGFVIGIFLAARQAKKEGVDPDRDLELGVHVVSIGHCRIPDPLRPDVPAAIHN